MTGRESFRKHKILINILVTSFSFAGKRINYSLYKLCRNLNGKLGLLLRYIFVKNAAFSLGDNVSIHPSVFLFNIKNLSIGDNVSIHPLCYIDAAGVVEIGNDVSIAHNCSIISTNHTWSNSTIPIKYNPEVFGKVCIKNDVWVGCGVRILAGVTISERSVIAAGAVVNKSFERNAVLGGIPASKIKII